MRDDITSIPISEVFEPMDGCPLCRLQNMLEQRMASYITGAAMMEPDIRAETNRLGFCHTHYGSILKQRKRLSVALMLESHLAEIEKQAFATGLGGKTKKVKGEKQQTCFICQQMDSNMDKFLLNIARVWEREEDFRKLYARQEYFCMPHCRALTDAALHLPKKLQGEFVKVTAERTRAYLQTLENDVSHFCKMFDYRNNTADADWGNSKDSIERAIAWLCAREVE